MNFIELTGEDGEKFIGNVHHLKTVFATKEGKTGIVGWNNNGLSEVKESYEEVINKLKSVNAVLVRL